MTREELLMLEYEKKLNYLYAKANTKSKKKRILYDLFNFSNISYEHFGIEKIFDWELDDELHELLTDLLEPFVEYTWEHKSDYLAISNSVLSTFMETKYPFYDDYCKLLYGVNKHELQEIILAFLNSYDYRLYRLFRDKLERNEIFYVNLYDITGYSGLNYPMDSLRKSLIFCEDGSSSIFSSGGLVHELGHSYENDIIYSMGVNGVGTVKDKFPFTEVSSRFFEYAFYNYLKENKVYMDDVRICLLKYYKIMLNYVYNMNLICKGDDLFINENGYAVINDLELSIYANGIKERLNYYNMASDLGEEMNYKHAFIYGLGSLFSIYLYDNYKKDPNYFKKEFRNALINYPQMGIEAFEKVGVTMDALIRGDTLKKVLEKSR